MTSAALPWSSRSRTPAGNRPRSGPSVRGVLPRPLARLPGVSLVVSALGWRLAAVDRLDVLEHVHHLLDRHALRGPALDTLLTENIGRDAEQLGRRHFLAL